MIYVKQFLRKPMGMTGAVMLGLVVLLALAAPLVAPYDPYVRVRAMPDQILAPPSAEHLLGTDDAGKDVLSQLIYGARVSLLVGFTASFVSMVIGSAVGLVRLPPIGGVGFVFGWITLAAACRADRLGPPKECLDGGTTRVGAQDPQRVA